LETARILLTRGGVDNGDDTRSGLDDVLADFEQRLTQLHSARRLPDEAHEAFRSFKEDVDRRLNADRRRVPRTGSDRRGSDSASAE
jgi:hypothetical protein